MNKLKRRERKLLRLLVEAIEQDLGLARLVTEECRTYDPGDEASDQPHKADFKPRFDHGIYPSIVHRQTRSWEAPTAESVCIEIPYEKAYVALTVLRPKYVRFFGNRQSPLIRLIAYEEIELEDEFLWVCDRNARKVSNYTRTSAKLIERSLLLAGL